MANNVTIPTTGSGDATPKVATEQVAVTLEHKQIVELAVPGTTLNTISADTANGLDVDVTRVQGAVSARANDGTNSETTLFDADSGAGTQYVRGVSLRLSASGGSVEAGTTTNPVNVAFVPATSGGCAIYHVVAAASTNAANIKASAGQVYGWNIFNNAAYPVYVKFHNTAGTPTAGAGVVHAIGVQAGVGRDNHNTLGIAFATGIGISIVKDITDAGATAVALSDCVADIYYK